MLDPHPDLTGPVIFGLGWLYLLMAAMNTAWGIRVLREGREVRSPIGGSEDGPLLIPAATGWFLYSTLLFLVALAHLTYTSDPAAFLIRMPEGVKNFFDSYFADPVTYFSLSVLGFAAIVLFREKLVQPTIAWVLLNVMLIFMALSMTDWDFRQIVAKPDNVPIVGMLFIVGYFTWLYFRRAVDNDHRRAEGRPLREQENNDKVLVWPDLVYTELICMVVLTVVLVAWGIALPAPLEEPASAVKTPNPSKAPWYFLGLQEMLVYYDPWLAGVVFPSVILVGLMAIPYIDFNKLGNGYYTFNERKFAISVFLFGFLPLWCGMIVLGTFLRGPNWSFFGIYEYWDVHKLELGLNVNLSEYFWVYSPWGGGLPTAPPDAGEGVKTLYILLREFPGILLTGLYLLALPPLMAGTIFRSFYDRMGFIRFMVFANLVLMMAALPIKMVLRWAVNLKYIIAIPEWFFNV